MAKSDNSRGGKRKPASKAADAKLPEEPQAASLLPKPPEQEEEAARKKHDEGVLERGEAVEAGKPMTPGTTHQIVGHRADGTPILKRTRFSLY